MTTVAHTAILELQDAAMAVLKADTTLMSRAKGIFDAGGVPENQAYPYVAFGEHVEVPFLYFGNLGRNTLLMLHIWSQQPSFKQALLMLDDVVRLLDGKKLTLTNFDNIRVWYEWSTQLNDPDDTTVRHIPVRFRSLATAK